MSRLADTRIPPEKSLALIDLSAKGQEWFRQGDKIEHLTLHEVKDRSVVIYQGDQFYNELLMPEEKVVSLLKSDQVSVAGVGAAMPGTSIPRPTGLTNNTLNRNRTTPRVPGRTPRGQSIRTRTIPAQPTLEEQKKRAEQNIENFKKMMKFSEMSKDQQNNMSSLLKVMENNIKKIEEDIEKSKADATDENSEKLN